MVVHITPHPTVKDFEAFTELPENVDRLFEFIGGEVVEVPSNPYASNISSRVNRRMGGFVEDNDLGYVTGEAGGYMVAGERYAPDVAFISKKRQPKLAMQGYNPNPPNLAVEVDFPSTSESQRRLRIKLGNYLSVGTTVWIIYPATQEVEVYIPGQPVKIFDMSGVLEGDGELVGFKLPVNEIFR